MHIGLFKIQHFVVVAYLLLWLCSSLFGAENSNVNILATLLEEDKLEEIAAKLPEVSKKFPNSPTVLYLQGILETDAKLAVTYFLKLLDIHSDSQFANRAALRIAQYHFACGNYNSAVKYYRTIVRNYPNSGICDHAAYHETQCYLALDKADSARILLIQFIQDFQLSPLIGVAIMDLEALEKQRRAVSSFPGLQQPNQTKKSKTYTVQVGAFRNKKNALDLVKKAMDLGYDVEGFRKGEGTEIVYVVWIGSFPSRAEAEEFAREFKKKHNMEYVIVPKPD